MPHFILEYTANLKADGAVPALLEKVNATLIAQKGVFSIGAIRSRAMELAEFFIADGAADYAFVHATLKIGAGRAALAKKAAGDAVFAVIKDHFAELFARRYLALSMEIYEFDEDGTYKHNNVHARFK